MTENIISFPGLGITIKVSPEAFSIGSLSVKWYGIIITLGIVVGFMYCYYRATKTEGINGDHIYNLTFWAVPAAIIGARMYYVLTTLDSGYDSFIDVIAIWNGGLAIYGAVIAGLLTVIIYCRVCKIKLLRVLDTLGPTMLLGQLIGRWGNFVNGECFGWTEGVENLPWRMIVTKNVYNDSGALKYSVLNGGTNYPCVHPTFLYESLWNLIGFLIINFIIYRRKKFDGQVFCAYIAWYGLGRGFIEIIRTDSLYVNGIKISVLVGFASMAAAMIAYILLAARAKKAAANEGEYVPKFAGIAMDTVPDEDILSRVQTEMQSSDDGMGEGSESEDYGTGEESEAEDGAEDADIGSDTEESIGEGDDGSSD